MGWLPANGAAVDNITIGTNIGGQLQVKKAFGYYFAQDTTGGTTSSASETRLSHISIPANTVQAPFTGIMVVVQAYGGPGSATNSTNQISIRVGTDNVTTTNNTLVSGPTVTGSSAGTYPNQSGGSLHAYYTGANWTVQNYVDVTGSVNAGGAACVVQRVTVFVF